MYKFHKLFLINMFFFVVFSFQQEIHASDSGELLEQNRIKSLAYQIIGFDSLSQLDSTESNIVINKLQSKNATTQALTDTIINSTIWIVYFADVNNMLRKYSPELNDDNPRDLLLFIDSSSGIPLGIISYHKGMPHKSFKNQSLAEVHQEFINRIDQNLITPRFPPKISFIEALSKVGGSDPKVERISAQYIVKNRLNFEDTPCWLLHQKVNLDNEDRISYPTNMKYISSITSYINTETGERLGEHWQ